MRTRVLVDTGPLISFLNREDRLHRWTCDQLANIAPPLWTCEAVLSEALFLLRRHTEGVRALLDLVDRGVVVPRFRLADEHAAVGRLIRRYANLPMSLADGCLVRLAEQTDGGTILTFDRAFVIYRMHGRRVVPTIMPPPAHDTT